MVSMTDWSVILRTANEERWDHQKDGSTTLKRASRVAASLEKSRVGPLALQTAHLRATQRVLTIGGLSPASVNRHLAALSSALSVALEEGLLDVSPRFPRRLTEGLPRDRCPTRKEVALVALHLPRSCRRLCLVLVHTGLRVGEALSLSPLDLVNSSLRVRTSKSGKPRTVPLPASLHAWAARGITFPDIKQSTFSAAWRKAREEACIGDWFVPHLLRHLRASTLVAAGAPVPVVAALLGHSDWRTTTRYTHVNAAGMQAAVEMVERRG